MTSSRSNLALVTPIFQLPESRIGKLLPVHSDERRSIFEFNGVDHSIQSFVIGPKRSALGNHYHTGKSEMFIITKGGGVLVMRAVDAAGIPCGSVFRTDLSAGNVIRVDPFMVHTFILEAGTEMLNYSSAPFDPNNMDMTPQTLVDPRTLAIIVT